MRRNLSSSGNWFRLPCRVTAVRGALQVPGEMNRFNSDAPAVPRTLVSTRWAGFGGAPTSLARSGTWGPWSPVAPFTKSRMELISFQTPDTFSARLTSHPGSNWEGRAGLDWNWPAFLAARTLSKLTRQRMEDGSNGWLGVLPLE